MAFGIHCEKAHCIPAAKGGTKVGTQAGRVKECIGRDGDGLGESNYADGRAAVEANYSSTVQREPETLKVTRCDQRVEGFRGLQFLLKINANQRRADGERSASRVKGVSSVLRRRRHDGVGPG